MEKKKNKSRIMRLEPLCLWFSCQFFVQTRRKCCIVVASHWRCAVCNVHSIRLLQSDARVQVRTDTLTSMCTLLVLLFLLILLHCFFNVLTFFLQHHHRRRRRRISLYRRVCVCVHVQYSSFINSSNRKRFWWLLFSLCFSFKHLTNTLSAAVFKCISE